MKKSYLLLLIIALAGCYNSFENKVAAEIENKFYKEEKCTINIKSLTDFDWDTLYYFKNNIPAEFQTRFPGGKEFTRKIIFTKGNTIILTDEEENDIENVAEGEVIFPTPDSLDYSKFTPQNAIFSASVRQSGKRRYYQLWLLQDSLKP